MIPAKVLEIERSKAFDDINIIREEAAVNDRHTFLDEWVVKDFIGRGAQGGVYVIVKSQPGMKEQECALKVCHISEKEDAAAMVREIESQMMLQGHSNAVQIEDYAALYRDPPNKSFLLIRMELLEPLPKGGLDEQDVLRLGVDICTALESCASCEPKLVHCDIKPENILRAPDGSYKLGDFGAAKTLQSTMGHTVGKGTLLYMAPEVTTLAGYDCRCDIYSLGFTMLTLLNKGVHPYSDKSNTETKKKIPSVKGASEALMKVIRKMCEKNVQARYQSASEVKNDLVLIVQKKWSEMRSEMRKKERRFVLAALVLIVISTILGGIAAYAVNNLLDKNKNADINIEPTPSEYFIFSETDAGVYVQGYTGDEKEIIIPEQFNGRVIVGIGSNAFNTDTQSGQVSVRTVVLPDGILRIEDSAFYGCGALVSIDIPQSVKYIGNSAFEGCSSLESISLPDGISELGKRAFYGCSTIEMVVVPDSISAIYEDTFTDCISLKTVELPESIVRIGSNAFSGCRSLEEINIPGNLIELGKAAFHGCISLKNIEIPEGISVIRESTFMGCTMLRTVVLPDSAVTLESCAFKDCQSLKSVRLSEKMDSIGDEAFYGCGALEDFEMPESLKNIGISAFRGCSNLKQIEIPVGVREINAYVFYECSSLNKVEIFGYIDNIGGNAFYGTALESVKIPKGVTGIKENAFANCGLLKNAELPEGLKSIGAGAFSNCGMLESIEIPDGLVYIGEKAFAGCNSIRYIRIPGSVKILGLLALDMGKLENIEVDEYNSVYRSVDGVLYSDDLQMLICYPDNKSEQVHYKVPESVSNIGSSAFMGCEMLQSVELPKGLKNIGDDAFMNCILLETVSIPDGIDSIGKRAFYNCSSLQTIYIPDGVTSIGTCVFYDCSSLCEITIPDSVTVIESCAFYNCGKLMTIDIPEGVTKIGRSAFAGCGSLEQINMPEGITEIEYGLFENCKALNTVYIPAGVTYIDGNPFTGNGLEYIEVSEDNHAYTSVDGVLYTKDMTELVAYPSNRKDAEFNMPSGVQSFSSGAFGNNEYIETITISDGMTSIESNSFSGMKNLKRVNISDSVVIIDAEAFGSGGNKITVVAPNEAKHYTFTPTDNITWIVEP